MLNRRLIFVTGKGGVGKSTVAHAIGRLGARQGKRVIVAELAPAGSGAGIDEVQLGPGLFSIVIDPQAAMEEYLRVKAGTLGGALSHSRLFSTLAMATPGLRELLGMGKIWELAQLQRRTRDGAVYDLVVVDAPATGHGVAALRTPRVFAQTARVGPIAYQADVIASTLADPGFTAIVAVAVAEEMPVRETLSLADALAADGLGLDRVVLNQVLPDRFTPAELEEIRAAAAGLGPASEGESSGERASASERAVRSALAAALSAQARARAQQGHARMLVDRFGDRLAPLPYLFCDEIGDPELDRLADLLEQELSLT